jgi:hypothetical protein
MGRNLGTLGEGGVELKYATRDGVALRSLWHSVRTADVCQTRPCL